MADYYIENGFKVFTAEYLKKRNQCCHSGCRHCPYIPDEELNTCHSDSVKPIIQGVYSARKIPDVQ